MDSDGGSAFTSGFLAKKSKDGTSGEHLRCCQGLKAGAGIPAILETRPPNAGKREKDAQETTDEEAGDDEEDSEGVMDEEAGEDDMLQYRANDITGCHRE